MVRITYTRLAGGKFHDHISHVKWINPADNARGSNTRSEVVAWIEKGGKAVVSDGQNTVSVGV